MSTYVCGFIKLASGKININKLREFSFKIQHVANTCAIGVNMGINATNANQYLKAHPNLFLFEFTDSPFEESAETLFAPEGLNEICEDGSLPNQKDLISRIKSVKCLISTMFQFDFVLEVTLIINYIFGDIDVTRHISLDELDEFILKDYCKSKYLTPAAKYIIRNNN